MFQEDADDHGHASDATAAHFGAKDIGWQALGPTIALTVLATCIVALRWYTRCKLVRCLGFDDYVILFSMALALAMCSVVGAAVHQGIGLVHSSPMETAVITKLVVTNNDLWALTVNVTKASILMQYLRIFSSPATRALCVLLLLTLLPAVLWAVLGGTLLCWPVSKLWHPELPGHCMNSQTYWLSVAGIDIGLDFLVILLPMPAISSLHLPRKQKLSLVLVFLLGFVVCGVSIARLATVLATAQQSDYVVSGVWAIIWSVVEATVGIICACLLALKPLIARLCPRLIQESLPPKHSTTLPMIQTARVWPESDSTTLVGDSPTTTKKSASQGTIKRPSLPQAMPSPVIEAAMPREAAPPPPRLPNGREMVMWDMLRSDMMY